MTKFTETVQASWGGASAAPKQEKKAAATKTEEAPKAEEKPKAAAAEEDDMDLFGDEEETEVRECPTPYCHPCQQSYYIFNKVLTLLSGVIIGGQSQDC